MSSGVLSKGTPGVWGIAVASGVSATAGRIRWLRSGDELDMVTGLVSRDRGVLKLVVAVVEPSLATWILSGGGDCFKDCFSW